MAIVTVDVKNRRLFKQQFPKTGTALSLRAHGATARPNNRLEAFTICLSEPETLAQDRCPLLDHMPSILVLSSALFSGLPSPWLLSAVP